MKKVFRSIFLASALIAIITLNICSLTSSSCVLNLNHIIATAQADTEAGSSYKCDYEGGLGLPFWDRVCVDCSIHFNNFYERGGTCYK